MWIIFWRKKKKRLAAIKYKGLSFINKYAF